MQVAYVLLANSFASMSSWRSWLAALVTLGLYVVWLAVTAVEDGGSSSYGGSRKSGGNHSEQPRSRGLGDPAACIVLCPLQPYRCDQADHQHGMQLQAEMWTGAACTLCSACVLGQCVQGNACCRCTNWKLALHGAAVVVPDAAAFPHRCMA